MIARIFTMLLLIAGLASSGQKLENNRDLIENSQKKLAEPLNRFFSECLLDGDYPTCVESLVGNASDPFSNYLIGGALYSIDPERSFKLHQRAYKKKKNELTFNLEYAMELHRKGSYKKAIPLYLAYRKEQPSDYRIHVWLSECYINVGNIEKSIEHWAASNHPSNHTGIDRAIHTIHGNTDQIQTRSKLRHEIASKNILSAHDLIFLDLNWEIDWWNTNIQEFFLEKDLQLIKETFGANSQVYLDLMAYNSIKHLSKGNGKTDSIKTALIESKLLVNGNRLLPTGKISSDLLRIALMKGIIDESEFFEERKDDLLKLADSLQDGELLNIYAYLESAINGEITQQTDKKGWMEYKDERFAISYFMGLAEDNRYDNPELKRALNDFPTSAKLQWVKVICAMIENREVKDDLIDLIKKDFKTLGSDNGRYSYGLKSYFGLLANGK